MGEALEWGKGSEGGGSARRVKLSERVTGRVADLLGRAADVAARHEIPPGLGRRSGRPAPTEPGDFDGLLAAKIAVGALVGVAAAGIIGPIVLAIVVGWAGGH